jgi:chromosome segregation ATPase
VTRTNRNPRAQTTRRWPPRPRPEDDALSTPEDVIADLKKKIDKLGPVNMMAIEQFDELESRHTFLTTQRKDLWIPSR